MPRRRRFGRGIAVLLATAVAFLAPVPMVTTPVAHAADPSVPTVPETYLNQKLTWDECVEDLDSKCAKVTVPMDWKNPSRGNLILAVAYLPAKGKSQGLLTSNPGGPSVPGLSLTEELSASKGNLRQYDLLGFDPRGFGRSSKIKCETTKDKLKKLPMVADRRVRNRTTHAMEVAEAKLFGEACSSQPLARYINTQQTVWDLEFLRRLMETSWDKSYPKLNYIGYSYGTWLGAWYADTYPSRVGKFILDSNMQWTSTMYANQALDSMSFQRRRDKMLFPYLARHNSDFKLGKSAKAVKKTYESTRAKLAKQAKKDLAKKKTPVLGPEDLDYITSSLIYANESFPSAGYIIQAAAKYAKKPSSSGYSRTLSKRIKTPMKKAPFTVQRSAKAVSGSAKIDISDGLAGTIVRCNDSVTPGNLRALLQRADADAKRYPFTGYLNTISLCAYWKFKPQTRTIDLAGAPKMLMFQSEGDPATAYEGALAAHRKTGSKTVLVSVDNEGQHGLYIDGPSKCLEAIGDAYLFTTGNPPPRDTRCSTSPLPDDKKVYPLAGPVSGAKSTAKKVVKAKNYDLKRVRADVAKRGLG
ncbi:MAG: alpha/beta hydrolase [Microlunatus sp.]|nr:alpha/beta hydrolase [Microlunatus sp.]